MPVIGPDKVIPFIIGGTDGEPGDVTDLGRQLYAAVDPLAYDDPIHGWALLRYCDALIQGAQQAETYGRGSDEEPGWAMQMNPDHAAPEALPWLAQFAGVDLNQLRHALEISDENDIPTPTFAHFAVNAVPAKWGNTGTSVATTFKVTEAWSPGHRALEVVSPAMAVGKFVAARVQGTIKLTGREKLLQVIGGSRYSLRATVNVTSLVGQIKIRAVVSWFNIKGELISTEESPAAQNIGVQTLVAKLTAPGSAVAAEIIIKGASEEAATKVTMLLDQVQLAAMPGPGLAVYGDGDTPGWQWEGTPGESPSAKYVMQSDEAYVEAQRSQIKELPASNRGTPAAIIAAAAHYLTGTKTVILREREGGAYKLTVITYIQETPNTAQVLAALQSQVPGGIILTYLTTEITSYIIIAGYENYTAVEAAFKTYNGLRLNKPGE